jgi:hypothetical protein
MAPSTLERKDGTVSAENDIRRVLRDVMKGNDRAEIARAMSEDLGRSITKSMLADFTRNPRLNNRRQVRFPAAWTKALCRAVNNDDLACSQLREDRRLALALGDLLLPWILKRAQEAAVSIVEQGRGKKAEQKQAPKA